MVIVYDVVYQTKLFKHNKFAYIKMF